MSVGRPTRRVPPTAAIARRCTPVALAMALAGLGACGRHADEGRTQAPAVAATPAPSAAAAPSADTAWQLAQQASGFTVGPLVASHTVYVFFDPACPHCAHLWAASQPLLGRLKMVWVPVGFLRTSSASQGATILSAAEPAAAMNTNETSVQQGGLGIDVPASLPADALAKVKANTALLDRIGATSVPLIVFRNAATGRYDTHAGAVETDELAAMAGV
jgi:thiol:disulfide interchange protein DsbG